MPGVRAAHGRAEYGVVNPMAAMYKVASDGDAVPMLPEVGHSTDPADFVATCCRREAARRPTAAALLDHPWLRELVSTGTGSSAPRDRTRKSTAASALNSKPRESFAGSQGVNEDDDRVPPSRCHASPAADVHLGPSSRREPRCMVMNMLGVCL
jgi:serine/threonine protein kinase